MTAKKSSSVREGGEVNKNKQTKTVSLLSEAIVAVMDEKQGVAMQLVAQALTSLTTPTPSAVAPATRKTRKKSSGRRPALNTTQVANLKARVEAGDSISVIAKNFGVSYPTAHRYYHKALEVATAPSN